MFSDKGVPDVRLWPQLMLDLTENVNSLRCFGAGRCSWARQMWSTLLKFILPIVAMLFCQFGFALSLREITGGLRSCERTLKHLGITVSYSPSVMPISTALGPVSAGVPSGL